MSAITDHRSSSKSAAHLRWAASAACAVIVMAAAVNASAQQRDWLPDTHRSGAGGEIYMWSARTVGTTLPVIGFANIGVTDAFFIDAYLPLASNLDGPSGRSRAGIGNPTAVFRYTPTHGIVRWWLGGGIGAPLASVDDGAWQLANVLAAISTSLYDSHLWVTDAFPMHATGGVDIRVIEPLSIQFGAKPIVYIPIARRNDVELVFQNYVGAEYRHTGTGVGAGLHFKVFYLATDRGNLYRGGDNFQLAMEPFFAYTGDTFFLRFGLLGALDRPLGFAFDRGGVFSPHLTLGGSWD